MSLDPLVGNVRAFSVITRSVFVPKNFCGMITDIGRSWYTPPGLEYVIKAKIEYTPGSARDVPISKYYSLQDVRLVRRKIPSILDVRIMEEGAPLLNLNARALEPFFTVTSHNLFYRIRGDYIAFYTKGECCLVAQA